MAEKNHPTWDAIPAAHRSLWYRVPGVVVYDRRGNPFQRGSGFTAQADIAGICEAGDVFKTGDIIPYRVFDHAAKQRRLHVFFGGGYNVTAVEPHPAELEVLYERFPAMSPIEPPKKQASKKILKETSEDEEMEGAE